MPRSQVFDALLLGLSFMLGAASLAYTQPPVWSIPVEATLEWRPVLGLTVRPFFGVRTPFEPSSCDVDPKGSGRPVTKHGAVCRPPPPSLYLGASVGWSFRFGASR